MKKIQTAFIAILVLSIYSCKKDATETNIKETSVTVKIDTATFLFTGQSPDKFSTGCRIDTTSFEWTLSTGYKNYYALRCKKEVGSKSDGCNFYFTDNKLTQNLTASTYTYSGGNNVTIDILFKSSSPSISYVSRSPILFTISSIENDYYSGTFSGTSTNGKKITGTFENVKFLK